MMLGGGGVDSYIVTMTLKVTDVACEQPLRPYVQEISKILISAACLEHSVLNTGHNRHSYTLPHGFSNIYIYHSLLGDAYMYI